MGVITSVGSIGNKVNSSNFEGNGTIRLYTETTTIVDATDRLFAFFYARSAVTPPSGWTLEASEATDYNSGALTQTIYVYSKDSTTTSDEDSTFEWTTAISDRWAGALVLARSTLGTPVFGQVASAGEEDTACGLDVATGALTADRGTEFAIGFGSQVLTGGIDYSATSGTWDTLDANPDGRFIARSMELVDGESTEATFDVYNSDVSASSCNAMLFTIRTDQIEQTLDEDIDMSQTDTPNLTYNVTDTTDILVGSNLGYANFVEAAASDSFTAGVTAALAYALSASVSESATLTPSETIVRGYGLALADTVDITPALSALWGLLIAEQVDVTSTFATTATFNQSLAQVVSLNAQATTGRGITVSQAMTLADTSTLLYGVSVIESLGLSEALLPSTTYSLSLAQSMALTDVVANFFGMSASDTVSMTATLTEGSRFNISRTDGVDVADTLTSSLVLKVTSTEGATLTASEALKLTYNSVVAEGISIGAAYLSPGGGITTWAVNTRNVAISEYSDFEFNSFARIGHKYLGARSDGLYELNGDDDDGTSIIAKIRSGQFQIAGSRFSSFKAAYIGIHGESDCIILKLESGTGQSYTYTVNTKDDATTRVRLGKGLRARYFTYELETTGQDFDLDTIEFIPIMATRRD